MSSRLNFAFVLLALLAAVSSSVAQILSFRNYTSKDGLLANGIRPLFQDSRGYLWIGTAEGVSVYDGAAFINYRTGNGLSMNHITCITESRASPGAIWIGTQGGGLNTFANGRFAAVHLDSTDESKFVNALMEDSFGTMWCGTAGGVYQIRDNRVIPFKTEGESLSAVDIVEAADGAVWIGFERVVYIYSPQKQGTTHIELSLSQKGSVQCLFADREGNVWIGTRDGLLLQFSGTALISRRRIADDYLWQIFDDPLGNLWICSESGILKMVKSPVASGKIARYTVENGLPENRIISGLLDREGNFWFGTPSKGLCKWANKNILTFPLTALPGEHYYHPPAAVSGEGHFWVIAGDGLREIWNDEKGNWREHLHRFSQPGRQRHLSSVSVDAKSRLWVGFIDSDIHGYEVTSRPDRASHLTLAKNLRIGVELPKATRQCFFVDENNRMWLSLEGMGILQIELNGEPKTLATYTMKEGLPDHSIRAIYEDRQGNMWFGGYEGGVAVLSPSGKMRKFTRVEGLPDEHVRAIHQDRDGSIWIGTRDGGLAVYAGGKFKTISVNEGLLSNTIWSIGEDDDDSAPRPKGVEAERERGRLWVGTALGMQSLDKNKLQPLPIRNDLLIGAVHGCGVYRNRLVWMATAEAFAIYDFAGEAPNLTPPPIHLTRMLMNAETIDLRNKLDFPHHQNHCTIEFTGISLKDEKATRYQYRLLGVVPDWCPPTSQRAVTFATLEPGAYTFEVRAINNDGVHSLRPATATFTILPPFWQRWWFRILVSVTIIAILAALYQYRVAKLLEIERTRLRIARDLHDEVGSTLSSISYFAQAIRNAVDARVLNGSEKFLSLIAESSSSAREAISDIIWSIDPTNDDWEKISAKLRRYAADLFESKAIRYQIDLPTSFPLDKIRMERRRHFWLIFKEMVTNAAKHSRCTEVQIELSAHGKLLRLLVQDNGIGLDPELPTNGNGVHNIRARAQSLRAHLDLQTLPGAGTRWEITFPA
ncbi:histidine kinase [candidate division KSB1 bacterium]|nr:histidine kinase [candidate division KSB1 bacterium]